MNADGPYSIHAPSEADMAAYHERVSEVGLAEASFEFAKQHAERLMAGVPVAVVEVPTARVFVLDDFRKEQP